MNNHKNLRIVIHDDWILDILWSWCLHTTKPETETLNAVVIWNNKEQAYDIDWYAIWSPRE